MDYQSFVDCCSVPCCVLSVERLADGSCGAIRIVCANESYRQVMTGFYEGMIYSELVPEDPKFEDFCYRAAILNQRVHAYVETKGLGGWTDQVLTPLVSDREDLGYCQFIFEFTKTAEPDRMARVSVENATAIVKAGVTLAGAKDFRAAVYEVLGDVCNLTDALCCRIMLVDKDEELATVFAERLRGDLAPQELFGEAGKVEATIPFEIARFWEEYMGVSNAIIIRDDRDMDRIAEANPGWVADMRSFGVSSLVLIPLRGGNEIMGWLYVTEFNAARAVEIKELLEMIAYILGPELANYLLMNRLERMSTMDMLTGIYNRNAMKLRCNDLDELEELGRFGVVVLDLNGLKRINDSGGHAAGDALLQAAANVLNETFRKEDLYRAGGDEFTVIAPGITQELFESRVEQLRKGSPAYPEVSFALGSYWSDGSMGVRAALRVADAAMYEDKKRYYEEHPELRR